MLTCDYFASELPNLFHTSSTNMTCLRVHQPKMRYARLLFVRSNRIVNHFGAKNVCILDSTALGPCVTHSRLPKVFPLISISPSSSHLTGPNSSTQKRSRGASESWMRTVAITSSPRKGYVRISGCSSSVCLGSGRRGAASRSIS